MDGAYSFPFTFILPNWLPQSHLCFNSPMAKKPEVLNTFKIRYNFIVAIESTEPDPIDPTQNQVVTCDKMGVTLKESQKMLHVRRITIITPELTEPLLNQE